MVCRPRNRSLGWRDTESFFYIYIYRREESGSMKGVRRVEGAASQYDKDVFQGSMSIGFPRSPCTTDIPHSFAGGISQYRRVQLIVTHFIYWNGKNVAFPPFLFFSSSSSSPVTSSLSLYPILYYFLPFLFIFLLFRLVFLPSPPLLAPTSSF